MFDFLSRSVGFALVLLLLLTSQSMAVARGAPGPAGQMQLCTGTGPVMVYVDADGAPVGPPHICPDFALTLLDHVAASPAGGPGLVSVGRRLSVILPVRQSGAIFRPRSVARAPPVPV
ncbi:hypothetical protein [Sedimentitalea sp. HM32M-2]|uniref:hypothetical protein n=1 Tax=Sedimentitalea sp. HM32M-2 TaxID=3351566 RepID=UPI0036D3AE18